MGERSARVNQQGTFSNDKEVDTWINLMCCAMQEHIIYHNIQIYIYMCVYTVYTSIKTYHITTSFLYIQNFAVCNTWTVSSHAHFFPGFCPGRWPSRCR